MLIKPERIQPYFKKTPIRGVIHIGAHRAEELPFYQSCGARSIFWVEANPHGFGELEKAVEGHLGSTVHRFAAHEVDGETVVLNLSSNFASSSVLPLGTHAQYYPDITYVEKIPVKAFRVDTVLKQKGFDQSQFNFANLDIQGAELLALRGMEEQFQHLDYLYLEVNEEEVYEGCALLPAVDAFLEERGFVRRLCTMTPHHWGDAFYSTRDKETDYPDAR